MALIVTLTAVLAGGARVAGDGTWAYVRARHLLHTPTFFPQVSWGRPPPRLESGKVSWRLRPVECRIGDARLIDEILLPIEMLRLRRERRLEQESKRAAEKARLRLQRRLREVAEEARRAARYRHSRKKRRRLF